jgi:hypothetical protein
LASHIIQLARNIVEDVSVTLSLRRYFVNVVGCSLRDTPTERELKEKLNMKKESKKKLVSKPSWLHN